MDMLKKQEIIKSLRSSTDMKQKEFAEYFQIPYRTYQDWELGNREMPDYLLRLMAYKLKMEQLVKDLPDME